MQPHGIALPEDKRRKLAVKAFELRRAGKTYLAIANALDVSDPTARNLVWAGARLIIENAGIEGP